LSSDIEEDDLDTKQEVLHLDQARYDETIRTTRVPPPKKRGRADTVIAPTSLANLQHLAGAIALPLLKRQKSTVKILHESDVVPAPAHPLPKAGGHQYVPQPKAGGNHNIPQYQQATFQVAKRFMEAIIVTKTPWRIISNEKNLIVDEARKLAIEAHHHQRVLAGDPVGSSSGCQLLGGASLKIDLHNPEAVGIYPRFYSSIGVMMILNPTNIRSQN
jgi:hypothetical protein